MVLRVKQLTKKYKNKTVLKDISFSINAGEIIGLVGPNGAGKSTLMRSILALEAIENGTITVNDIANNQPDFYKYISFLPSDNYLYMSLTGYDHLSFVANIYNLEKTEIEETIDLIGIRSYVNQPIKSYSYGMRQHLLIALSILTKPIIILMDEPFNGLDPTSIIELKQLIRTLHSQGISIFISTHNLDILEDLTQTIWFIKDGELFTNSPVDTMSTSYEIAFFYQGNIEELMKDSYLPFKMNDSLLMTNSAHSIEKYLEWLIKNGVQIQSVNRSKRNLEDAYRHFYDV
ncbi:ABC transporter ATP-binding protein [Metasolibacillus sp.]|uniref:ABC transporter ATP-binding protein n=1 Tax=Metasolibacillus sp. TaxID=2703680 RepID=UPI0025E0AEAD|nr:ABC transporter ATP-binding protein [Metasolibacillus sp.]MCT6923760.1 ABC transporter ATP-binding protein [Metasolibacillus sp.]MCT6940007.1 ABC transporter ATP-binding protein [Metasolibacillus sp.]